MVTIENTTDRVKTFVTKLRIITNIEDHPTGVPSMPNEMPSTISTPTATPSTSLPKATNHTSNIESDTDEEASRAPVVQKISTPIPPGANELSLADASRASRAENMYNEDMAKARRRVLLAALMNSSPATITMTDADTSLFVKTEFEKLDSAYEEVNRFAMAEEQEAQDLLERLGEKRTLLASTPTRVPTLGYITSDYGVRISPYDGRRKMHEGIDIANRYGSDIIAPADGVIIFAGTKPGYGKMVEVDHGNGIETRFAHSSRLYVQSGQRVHRGQRLAAVGNTGHSTGPHCHYEVRAGGLPVDPCWYILDFPALCKQHN